MKVLNDYNKCLTNYACSIRKYFGLEYKHNTIKEVDDLLEKYKPRNVITFLFDGMGTYVLNRTDAEFFKENKLMDLHSVFPATTVACTTSVRTGLNPVETNMLGWNMYYDELDRDADELRNYLFYAELKPKEKERYDVITNNDVCFVNLINSIAKCIN